MDALAPVVRPETLARRVSIAHRPGAVTLVSQPERGGYTWAGRFETRGAAIANLIRRALSVTVDEVEP
jgi:hypothetical protein